MAKSNILKSQKEVLVCFFILISVLIVYWEVQYFDFINYDDDLYITENINVSSGLSRKNIKWAFTNVYYMCWHPLTWLSHIVDCQFFGLKSEFHHIVNLFLHIINSILLFVVIRYMTGTLWRSAFVALLFALHPINVDSVAWVAQRKNLLCTFFWFLTLLAYASFTKRTTFWRYLTTFIAFALGIMSKPMMVSLPIVLFLLDYWPLNRFQGNVAVSVINKKADGIKNEFYKTAARLFLEKIPFFLISLFLVCIVFFTVNTPEAEISIGKVPLNLRIENAFVSYIMYIGKMICPTNLSFFYPFPVEVPLWKTTSSAFLLLCTTAIAVRLRKVAPYFIIGWLWYIITLLPVSGIKQAGAWPAMADRWAYIPLIGIFIIIAWGTSDLLKKFRYKKAVLTATAIVIIFFVMIFSMFQVKVWKDSISLNRHAINVTANNCLAHNNLGCALVESGRLLEAIPHFIEALKLSPDYNNARIALEKTLGCFEKEVSAAEKMQRLMKVYPEIPELYYVLGRMYEDQEEFGKAIAQYRKSLSIHPDFTIASNRIAIIIYRKGMAGNCL